MTTLTAVEENLKTALREHPIETPDRAACDNRATLHVCGLNHTMADVARREAYALSGERIADIYRRIRDEAIAPQALVLSTCNRTEIYLWSGAPDASERLRELFASLDEETESEPPLYQYRGLEAVRHLFRVTAGLDSMILGENQIKQQLRRAYEISQEQGACGAELHRTIEAALRAGKRIRTETDLNVGTMCVGIAAVLKGEQELGGLEGRTCLVIGAGKIGRMAVRALAERRPARLLIVNRSIERARELARSCGGEAHPLEALDALLPEADFILGAADVPRLVIERTHYRTVCPPRRRPARVCMVDAAVPRILDGSLNALRGVRVFDIEQMEGIIEQNRERREGAARQARRIVEQEVEKFRAAQAKMDLGPAVRRLRRGFDRIFEEETVWLELHGDEEEIARLKGFLRRLKQRLLHEAIQELKRQFAQGDGETTT